MKGVQVVATTHDDTTHGYCSHWVMQVSFDEPILVASVITSGRGDAQEWVTEFTLSHSVDGETFTFIENPIDHYRA